tara:strand:- start:20627 stop:21547 length:921 start_codon:yes stop_codon:yes gene_type:complete
MSAQTGDRNAPVGQDQHIALCVNDVFWPPAFTVIRSICLTATHREKLRFHLVVAGIPPMLVEDLRTLKQEFGVFIEVINVDEHDRFAELVETLPTTKRFPPIIYARIFLAELLSKDIERVLYLDADTLVLSPLDPLFSMPLGNMAAAAVTDPQAMRVANGRDVRNNRDLFDPSQPYFNSGVLLIDLPAWRALDIAGKISTLSTKGVLSRLYFDQDLLNLLLRGHWLELDRLWNVTHPHDAHQILNPHILHFTGSDKPWRLLSKAGYARLYRHVMTNDMFYRYWRQRALVSILGDWAHRLTARHSDS